MRPRLPFRAFLFVGLVLLATLLASACTVSRTAATPKPTPSTPPLVYVAVGASESVGVGATDTHRNAWTQVFFRTALPRSAVFVNMAVPGSTVADALAAQVPEAVALSPDVVTVWLNVNDILHGVTPASYEGDLTRLVTALRRGGATKVLVANTPPLDDLPAYRVCLPGATATFHGSKIGLHVAPGTFHAGLVEVIEIGIPREAPGGSQAGLICDRVLELVPHRRRDGSKFKSGTVVIAGGAAGYTGAPCMAALGAQRTGAGYIQLAVPHSAQQAVALRVLEGVTRGLPEEDGMHVPDGVADVQELAERAGAVILGPGLGRSDGARKFARAVARSVEAPLLIDADGLNAHIDALETLRERKAPTVLTPHEGELARLLGIESAEVAAHRLKYARDAAERSGAIVVLKGDDSLVATPGGPVAISPGATAALATAGTGDVLSGVIGALLSKGVDAFAAAAGGVFAHARAGKVAATRLGADHTVAGDVIEALPEAFARSGPG